MTYCEIIDGLCRLNAIVHAYCGNILDVTATSDLLNAVHDIVVDQYNHNHYNYWIKLPSGKLICAGCGCVVNVPSPYCPNCGCGMELQFEGTQEFGVDWKKEFKLKANSDEHHIDVDWDAPHEI